MAATVATPSVRFARDMGRITSRTWPSGASARSSFALESMSAVGPSCPQPAVAELLRAMRSPAWRPSAVAAQNCPVTLSRSIVQNPAWYVPPCPFGAAFTRRATARCTRWAYWSARSSLLPHLGALRKAFRRSSSRPFQSARRMSPSSDIVTSFASSTR